jgi:hypothetical protein
MSEISLGRKSFPQSVLENVGYYVYRLIDPRDRRTFYVGKGTGNRLFQHVAAARDLPDRSSLKLDRIREIEASGEKVRYLIHRHGLTEAEALLVESALIDAYEELVNAQLGHGAHESGLTTVDDLIALYDKGAADIDVPAVLVNLRKQYERGLTAEQLYARSRGYWTFNPDRHPNVRYGIAVAFGIIREVYVIQSWERKAVEDIVRNELRRANETQTKSKFRWAFIGSVATDIRDRLVGKSVVWPSQSSFLWKNC